MHIRRTGGALGAEISDIRLTAVSAEERAALAVALAEYGVLFLRNQYLSPADFQAFAAGFGEVMSHPAYGEVADAPGVQILESTPEVPSKIEMWHSDMTFRRDPPLATALMADVIPEYGGDTLWTSSRAAWQALSPAMRDFLAPLGAIHDFRHGFRESLAEPGGEERLADAVRSNPPVVHPIARRLDGDDDGALFVNSLFTTRICDLAAAESKDLLEFLHRHLTTEEFTTRLRWEPGTVVIWDNRSTQHKPVNDYFPQHRRLHRVTVCGDVPQPLDPRYARQPASCP